MTTNYRYLPRHEREAGARGPLMLIGFGGYEHEASREVVMQLVEKWISWHPRSTEAEAESALRAMSRGELTRMAMDRHEMDRGQAAPGNACVAEYDPLPVSQGPSDDGLRPPSGGERTGGRGWY
jgi:hypothetical protein